MILMYPPADEVLWPTLGPQVCAFIEAELCHGPGDLMGQPVKLNDEQKAWIYRLYEVHPPSFERITKKVKTYDKNPHAGRRRFQRGALSLRKGSSKTEFAAWLAAVELHAEGPVRCDGFESDRPDARPISRGVTDPYIPMIAYTEEQTEELAYGALRRILESVSIGGDFDIGLERIMRVGGDGKAEAVSASPNARDGARTTFEHADETHRFTLDKMKRGWSVMLANLAKRPLADPWALETTTAPEPGAQSVAETTMEHARGLLDSGKAAPLFFFHRQAADAHDLATESGLTAAVTEASGPYIAEWSDIPRIVGLFTSPDADRSYLERVWCNRPVQASGKAFDLGLWKALKKDRVVPNGAAIALGFDGSRYDDATALVACELATKHLWTLGIWEKPATASDEWEVPVEEVVATVEQAFERYSVVRMYGDPPKWEGWLATWAGKYGKDVVVEWWTNRLKPMAYAIRSFVSATAARELSHAGDRVLTSHVGNACKKQVLLDDEGKPLYVLRKERPESPFKIDGAMAAVLAVEACNDALTAGLGDTTSIYESRGVLRV
jgi:hypothetical protein